MRRIDDLQQIQIEAETKNSMKESEGMKDNLKYSDGPAHKIWND